MGESFLMPDKAPASLPFLGHSRSCYAVCHRPYLDAISMKLGPASVLSAASVTLEDERFSLL